jgi:hypothetical protein
MDADTQGVGFDQTLKVSNLLDKALERGDLPTALAFSDYLGLPVFEGVKPIEDYRHNPEYNQALKTADRIYSGTKNSKQGVVANRDETETKILPSRNWGILKKDVDFLSYGSLQKLFYGMHNLTVPYEMLASETQDEIFANFMAAAYYKKSGLTSTLPQTFPEVVRAMNSHVYRGTNLIALKGVLQEEGRRRFGDNQQERLSKLDEIVGREFVQSLNRPYRFSNREVVDGSRGDYEDPNSDGHSKNIYARAVWDRIQKMYDNSIGN